MGYMGCFAHGTASLVVASKKTVLVVFPNPFLVTGYANWMVCGWDPVWRSCMGLGRHLVFAYFGRLVRTGRLCGKVTPFESNRYAFLPSPLCFIIHSAKQTDSQFQF